MTRIYPLYTGLFISPSGNSDLCGTVTGMVTPKGSMLTEGEVFEFFVLPYRFSICPPLVTWQMSNVAILADSKTQNASLFHAMFRHDCPLTVKFGSTQWNHANKKILGEILHLMICSFLVCLSWLLCSWVRKFRRDLRITLYKYIVILYLIKNEMFYKFRR
jgi:hypothetical protein